MNISILWEDLEHQIDDYVVEVDDAAVMMGDLNQSILDLLEINETFFDIIAHDEARLHYDSSDL